MNLNRVFKALGFAMIIPAVTALFLVIGRGSAETQAIFILGMAMVSIASIVYWTEE